MSSCFWLYLFETEGVYMRALFSVPDKKKYTREEQEQIIRGIDGTMSLEGMDLTDEDKDMLCDILSGKKSADEYKEELRNECLIMARQKGWVDYD